MYKKMSIQQISKVDLSLDDIIKLNKKEQKHKQSQRGGKKSRGIAQRQTNRIRRAGVSRSEMSGVTKQQAGGAPGVSYRSQRGNLRGWAGRNNSRRPTGSRGGSMQRNLPVATSGGGNGQNAATFTPAQMGPRRGIFRDNLQSAMELAAHAGFEPQDIQNKLDCVVDKFREAQLLSENRNMAARKVVLDKRYDRERLLCESDDFMIIYDCKRRAMFDWFVRKERQELTHFEEDAENCVKNWRPANMEYQPFCDLLSINVSILAAAIRQYLGARGNMRGAMRGRGMMVQGRVNNVQGFHGQSGRVSLKQKRLRAMKALQEARKTITQLDQQQARQNFVNAKRGILQQTEQLQVVKKDQEMYSSNTSLASTNSLISSASSARSLQGTKVTTFTTPRPVQQQRRWRENRSSTPGLASSTLTISFDNIPAQSGFANTQGSSQRGQRRRQWRRNKNHSRNTNPNNNSMASDISSSGSSYEDIDNDLNRGASTSFSQQLVIPNSDLPAFTPHKLKPTVSTKYVFQKKAFATGNTSCSLNDRFSSPISDDLLGRKVYM